jgi:hypothetical protein
MRDDTKWLNEVKVTPQTTNRDIIVQVSTYLGTINGLSTSSTEYTDLCQLLVTKLTERLNMLISKQAQDSLDKNNGNIYTAFNGVQIHPHQQHLLGIIQLLSDKCNKYENMIGDLHGKCNKYENMIGDLHSRCTALESFCVVHADDCIEWKNRISSLEKANPNLDKYATMIQKNFKLYIFKKRIKEMAQLSRLQQKFQTMTEPVRNMRRKAAEDRIYKENNRGVRNNASRDPNDWTVEKAAMMSKLWVE